jgi:hypothetical protein
VSNIAVVRKINSDGTVNVSIPPDLEVEIENRSNIFGGNLIPGDSVILFSPHGDLGSSGVLYKIGEQRPVGGEGLPPPYPSVSPGTYTVGQSVQLLSPTGYQDMVIYYTANPNIPVNSYTLYTGELLEISANRTIWAYGVLGLKLSDIGKYSFIIDSIMAIENIPETSEGVFDSILAVLNTSVNTDVSEQISESIQEELNITATVTLIY